MGVHIADTCIDTPVAFGAQGFLQRLSKREPFFRGHRLGMEDFPMCGYCNFATAARLKCTCRRIRYCDQVCQGRGWSRHRGECTWWLSKRELSRREAVEQAGKVFLQRLSKREPFFDQLVVKLLDRFLG